ncbi:hypothetical protein VB716_05735 [Synechococcus sp. CCY9201]|uniref:hypothetical protein n=2 Tax=Synechococcus TaxID=1129 RepID=UPI001E3DBA95|nr:MULTISPECIES: hypothetical protein [unclassified Synechococcus]MEA5423233.1 hypothetical protein [Synechococcus sp. CCY9202]MEA5473717.1 hypothetical protein [Synechococcus sp. CCY9201]CAK6693697.1 hypothetical protein IFHNHDMJ_01475 [Synechococcus sp. CBW1107]
MDDVMHRWIRYLGRLGLSLALLLLLALPAQAGSVDWRELPATEEGKQWWDAGSLRRTRDGNLSVLSRYLPPPEEEGRPRLGDLYVMELDCGQKLYRDTAVNGVPRFKADWQPAGGDQLLDAMIDAVCAAGSDLPA